MERSTTLSAIENLEWGLARTHLEAVEDITIRVTRPGGAGLRHNDHHVKPNTKLEDGGSIMGLRPEGGLRPVVITRRYGKSCNGGQE